MARPHSGAAQLNRGALGSYAGLLPTYRCVVQPGTGSAAPFLTPMLDAWASAAGLTLEPGTLNLCADRTPVVSQSFQSLHAYTHLVQPSWRRRQSGFDPRLYPVTLNGKVPAWLYRWSAEADLHTFVGDTPLCPAERHCEIVATSNLRASMGLKDGDVLTLDIPQGA